MGLAVLHIESGHHIFGLEHAGEVMRKPVQQGLLSRACDEHRRKPCRLYFLQEFPSSGHAFRFGVCTELRAFLRIDALYHFGRGVFAVLPLIDKVDGGGAGASFVQIRLLAAQMQAVAFHHFVPGIGVIGHGIEQYAVHIEEDSLQSDVRVPVSL